MTRVIHRDSDGFRMDLDDAPLVRPALVSTRSIAQVAANTHAMPPKSSVRYRPMTAAFMSRRPMSAASTASTKRAICDTPPGADAKDRDLR